MITENLYDQILINPVSKGYDELHIVSGYSSATFLRQHLGDVLAINPNIEINLIIGMNQKRRDHSAYLNLKDNYPNLFNGYYFYGRPEVHSKVYCWTKNKTDAIGFSGSSNYSQYGFFNNKQQNQMVEDNPADIKNYYNSLINNCTPIWEYSLRPDEIIEHQSVVGSLPPGCIEWIEPDKSVRISLLSKNGELPPKSGLNWGQRPEHNRAPNQAYLSIRTDATKEGFLPEKKFTFTLVTDDNVTMDCTVQQDGRKAISTTKDNSVLGLYFRNRLGVSSGAMVTKDHLVYYGRSDFLLKKLDDETFFLDFSAQ